jgi:hypothetical protein
MGLIKTILLQVVLSPTCSLSFKQKQLFNISTSCHTCLRALFIQDCDEIEGYRIIRKMTIQARNDYSISYLV